MYHSPKWFHLTKNIKSSWLSDEQDTLLNRHIKIKDIHKLHYMISLQMVDKNNCLFRSGLQLLRLALIIIIVLLFLNIIPYFSDFKENWSKEEQDLIYKIQNIDHRQYPSNNAWDISFDEKKDKERRGFLTKYIGNDLRMNLEEYLYYRYNEYAYGEEYLVSDILMVIFHAICIPLCFYAAFLSKQKAPLTLIRDRQLFITWINGKAFVARYSQVGVVETHQAVSLILYGLNKDKHIIKTAFVLPTNPTFIMSSSKGRKDLLAFITKYMVWGLSAVASTEYERNMPYYLRKDKKPDNFEQQVDEILAVLDKQDPQKIA